MNVTSVYLSFYDNFTSNMLSVFEKCVPTTYRHTVPERRYDMRIYCAAISYRTSFHVEAHEFDCELKDR